MNLTSLGVGDVPFREAWKARMQLKSLLSCLALGEGQHRFSRHRRKESYQLCVCWQWSQLLRAWPTGCPVLDSILSPVNSDDGKFPLHDEQASSGQYEGHPGVLHADGPENCHSAKHEPDLHSKDVFQNTNQTGKNRKEGEGEGRGGPGGGARGEAAAGGGARGGAKGGGRVVVAAGQWEVACALACCSPSLLGTS